MYKLFLYTLLGFTAVFSLPAMACQKIPDDQNDSLQDLVKRTAGIVLARAYTPQLVENDLFTTRFYITRTIKGTRTGDFELTGLLPGPEQVGNDFNNHDDLTFWAYSNTGNFKRKEDCSVYGYFESGEQYLIFLDPPYHPRSFEIVKSDNDSWLKEVIKMIQQ